MERGSTRGSGEWHSVCGRPYLPHFHCSTTLCVAPNFTYLASVFAAVIPKPTCLLTGPPIIGQTFLLSRNSSKKVRVLPHLQLTPFYSSWLKGLNARCIVFYASSPFFAFFQSSCSLIRSQISTVRKKYQKWQVIPTLSVHNVHIVQPDQRICQTLSHMPIDSYIGQCILLCIHKSFTDIQMEKIDFEKL